jgi:hypothetical protein
MSLVEPMPPGRAYLPQQQVRICRRRVIVTLFPSTSTCPGIPRRRIVVEIVDVDSPEFHKVQQVRISNLLNLKMCKEADPLRPSRFTRKREISLLSMYSVQLFSRILLRAVEAR